MYAPPAGRWLSKDPAGYVDGPNQYLYVRNNPINGIDPSGLAACAATSCDPEMGVVTKWSKPAPAGQDCDHPCKMPIIEVHEATHRKNMSQCCGFRNKGMKGLSDKAKDVYTKIFNCWLTINEVDFEKLAAVESCFKAIEVAINPPVDPFRLSCKRCIDVASAEVNLQCQFMDKNAKISPCPFDKDGDIIDDVAKAVIKECKDVINLK